jgi:hypothetical protein
MRSEEMQKLMLLSFLLEKTPSNHPRKTWIRILRVVTGFGYDNNKQRLDEVFVIVRFLIPIFRSQTNILEFGLTSSDNEGFPMHPEAMKVLSESQRDTLTKLDVNSSPENIPGLFRIISQMAHLSSLTLTFTPALANTANVVSRRYKRFADVPLLHMPNITEFRWNWRDKDTRPSESDIQYLANCRFHSSCQLYLEFDHDFVGLFATETEALNSLFLHHHSKRIELCRVLVSATSSVLMQAEQVNFQVGLPHPGLFEADHLPSVVTFFMLEAEEVIDLWPVLDTLLRSDHKHSMHIQIDVKGLSLDHPDYHGAGHIIWERPPEENIDEDIIIITYRLMQYARELEEKGIILVDSAGLAFGSDCEDVMDAMFEEKWMYLY